MGGEREQFGERAATLPPASILSPGLDGKAAQPGTFLPPLHHVAGSPGQVVECPQEWL